LNSLQSLEEKWANEARKEHDKKERRKNSASKTEQVNAEQPQDTNTSFGEADQLEPVEATKVSMCSLCKSYIERGEAIVNAGDGWVHAACASNCGWPVAGNE
jgi:hypothetical protein